MVLINELLEEAVSRSRELSDEALATAQAVSAVIERAHEVGERIAREGEEAHGHFQALAARLQEVHSDLQGAVSDARLQLDRVVGRSREVEGRVAELLEQVHKGTTELETQRSEALRHLEQQADETEQRLGELSGTLDELEHAFRSGGSQAGREIALLLSGSQAARGIVEQKRQELQEAMDALETELETQVNAVGEALEESIIQQNAALVGVGDKLVEQHNEMVAAVVRQLTEDAFAQIDAALAPLRTAVESLETACAGSETVVVDRCGEITTKLRALGDLLARMKPALDMMGQLR
jgi:hypothetical protein